MKDDFLKRVIERRNSEQTETDYIKRTPSEDSATRSPWESLGPRVPLYEDWMCRWCGEINRRRTGAENQPSCKKCYKNMKPCVDCGGPVGKSESDRSGKPSTICKECWQCY